MTGTGGRAEAIDRIAARHPDATRTIQLLDDPGLCRLWDRCVESRERGGDDRGRMVTVPDPNDAERALIYRVLGRTRRGTGAIRVKLDDLDDVLRRSPASVGLDEWLAIHAGRTLVDRRAVRSVVSARRDAVRSAVEGSSLAVEQWFEGWLTDLERDGLLGRIASGVEHEILGDAVDLLERLPADGVSLGVLAAELTGDAKRLTDSTLATVIERALAARAGVERPTTAAQRRRLWADVGVVWDDLSSQVLVLNLPGRGYDQIAIWLDEAASFGEPFVLTLRQLGAADEFDVTPGLVRICENPALLLEAANQLGPESSPLVCVGGRPSNAAMLLLDRLTGSGCRLAYHGDFDWPGVGIAGSLIDGDRIVPWRYRAADYQRAMDRLDRCEALAGTTAETPWDPALAPAMADARRVVYEEQVVDDLIDDLRHG